MTEQEVELAKSVPMELVLAEAGFDVPATPGDVQFRCHLHGDGQDSGPSARLYRESNHVYCWGCHKNYDPIELTKVHGKVNFPKAVEHLIDTYIKGNGSQLRTVPRMSLELGRRVTALEEAALRLRSKTEYKAFIKIHLLLDALWYWATKGDHERFDRAEARLKQALPEA